MKDSTERLPEPVLELWHRKSPVAFVAVVIVGFIVVQISSIAMDTVVE
ncbi:hypothetical protein [Glycomyces sp. NRRL B-16210]|nr:hypothetical protein [Glycomyces sp. NRRL B-16210]